MKIYDPHVTLCNLRIAGLSGRENKGKRCEVLKEI